MTMSTEEQFKCLVVGLEGVVAVYENCAACEGFDWDTREQYRELADEWRVKVLNLQASKEQFLAADNGGSTH